MIYRKIKLTHYSHKAVRQGELAYVESKDRLIGSWCQKLPVEDGIYYVSFDNSIPSITRKDLENWDKNYKCDYTITKVIRGGYNVTNFVSNGFKEDGLDYIEKLYTDFSDKFSEFYKDGYYEMYRIIDTTAKKKVVCNSCYRHGEIKQDCNECGGIGIRNKTVRKYKISDKKYKCNRIDMRLGCLRFWDGNDYNSFYYENSSVFFTLDEANKKCTELNESITQLV